AALAEAGAHVIVSSRDPERAREAASRLPRRPGQQHFGIELDHQRPDDCPAWFTQALGCTGQIDVLINNGNEAVGADLTTVTPEQFSRQLANATGYFVLARLLRDHVVARQASGSIV
ncbi:MAG: SDR family NAD(P)-dependent oxidoreductase, partial [Planctomycetaceae bacterium]